MKNILTSLLIIFFSATTLFAQITQTIRGKITDATTGNNLSGASVQIIGTSNAALSDNDGNYIIEKVPVGRYQLSVTYLGYQKEQVAEIVVVSGKETIVDFQLQPTAYPLDETVVKAASPNLSGAVASIENITIEQVMRFPGTFFDPARLAQSYAGVVNADDQANGMVIRGNSPNSMQWRLEGVEIVNPNHLSNAGTFGDRATQNAGGVNILSAQLLGNMNFLTGAFPADYGNALSGVMDMRLRKGNNQKREYTAQVGLIGVDLAAEGPFSLNKQASYLINYRYSFTGLLGLMGIDFGGESITFQDLSFNFAFPTQKAGTFTVFGMGGNSSNIYAAPRDAEWQNQKENFDINFYGKMRAIGITHELPISSKTSLRSAIVGSALQSLREGYRLSATDFSRNLTENDSLTKQLISYNSTLKHRLNDQNILKIGLSASHRSDDFYSVGTGQTAQGKAVGLLIEPFVNWQWTPSSKIQTNVGLHYLRYTYNATTSVEPRASVQYKVSPKNTLSVAYGLHSQLQLPQTYLAYNQQNESNPNAILDVSKAHHFVLSHQFAINQSSVFKTELYYQQLFNIPVSSLFPTFSALNLIDLFVDAALQNTGKGKNYGIELTYQKFLTKGLFVLANASLYNSTYTGANNKEYSTRFNGKHIFNLTLGKEWQRAKGRQLGINGRVVWLGGLRDTPIDLAASQAQQRTVYDMTNPFSIQQKDYFRPDIRVYFRKSKEKYSRMFSIDIQNVANYQNQAYSYYDFFQNKIIQRNQLGMVPMMNYRVEF